MTKEMTISAARSLDRARMMKRIETLLNDENFPETFREIGRFMDKYDVQVPPEVIAEYKIAARFS